MVAITVLLAATAATFFLGFQSELSGVGSPRVAIEGDFQVDSSGHKLILEFTGGEVVARENLYVHVSSANCISAGSVSKRFPIRKLGVTRSSVAAGISAEVTVGTVCPPAASQLKLSSTEVTVSWVPNGDSGGTVLYRWRGPSA